ncbi:MAG: DUF3598 family protein [Acidobacteriota bacterium]|nr:DUF3598 family protein [Blastocatellia bacterium]MDW8240082.1 DUF3598 family protein [Acidobacteriota bacterium]
MSLREAMPLLARHEGEWKGTYIYVDAEAKIIDQHASHLTCRFPEDNPDGYHQTNHYTWPDGREEIHQFPATYRDGKIWFDTERIKGYAWEADENTILLTWVYKTDPENYLYEMIQLSPDGNHRARTWHWFKDGELVKRTLIKEVRVR